MAFLWTRFRSLLRLDNFVVILFVAAGVPALVVGGVDTFAPLLPTPDRIRAVLLFVAGGALSVATLRLFANARSGAQQQWKLRSLVGAASLAIAAAFGAPAAADAGEAAVPRGIALVAAAVVVGSIALLTSAIRYKPAVTTGSKRKVAPEVAGALVGVVGTVAVATAAGASSLYQAERAELINIGVSATLADTSPLANGLVGVPASVTLNNRSGRDINILTAYYEVHGVRFSDAGTSDLASDRMDTLSRPLDPFQYQGIAPRFNAHASNVPAPTVQYGRLWDDLTPLAVDEQRTVELVVTVPSQAYEALRLLIWVAAAGRDALPLHPLPEELVHLRFTGDVWREDTDGDGDIEPDALPDNPECLSAGETKATPSYEAVEGDDEGATRTLNDCRWIGWREVATKIPVRRPGLFRKLVTARRHVYVGYVVADRLGIDAGGALSDFPFPFVSMEIGSKVASYAGLNRLEDQEEFGWTVAETERTLAPSSNQEPEAAR